MEKVKKNYAKIKRRFLRLIDRLIVNINKPEMRVLPGQLAFFFFMALIPIISLIGSLISLFDLPYNSISDVLNTYLPTGTSNLLIALSVRTNMNINYMVFLFSAIFLASKGMYSMIITSNEIYKIKYRGYVRGRLKSLLMMFVVLLLLLFVLLIPVFGDSIFNIIKAIDMNNTLKNTIYYFYKIIKYPISFLLIYFLIKILYIMAPDKKIDRHNVIYGAMFTSFSWVVLTQIYSFYVENFTNYTTFYGSIASILILMIWLYLLCYIFVLGMALNFSKYEIVNDKE